ncbi:MAG: hypothetical protein J6S76_00650 [Clostridia bacterium]|nr:hypothetical protein [Clostridia bacterium]
MVKKLFSHECVYYLRTLGMFLPIVLVIGIMTRIFRCFDDRNIINKIALSSSVLLLVLACMALIVLSVVVCIIRFYRNLYSSEGYLTFTLPVTHTEHLIVKLSAAMLCQVLCVLTVIASASIALSGSLLGELLHEIYLIIQQLRLLCGTAHLVTYALELLLLTVLSAATTQLLYYACITVGQTAKKNRILMAVAAYFIYYTATQIIATVFSMIITVLSISGALNPLTVWIESHITATIHIYLCFIILICAIMAAAFWFITKTIMSKKLNLE